MTRPTLKSLLLLLGLSSLIGCAGGAAPSGAATELVTNPETASYRDASARGFGSVTWAEPAAAPGEWSDPPDVRSAVKDAIRASANSLASVDYTSLALPDFKKQTAALTPKPAEFTGDSAEVDGLGKGDDNRLRWVLYRWVGPQFPAHPGRPLVTRWIHVYALYDPGSRQVKRLVATIWGQVEE